MAEELVCPICGKPTRVYMGNARRDRLCAEHADLLKAGKLQPNADGTFGAPKKAEPVVKSTPVASSEKSSVCPICGADAKGKDVCVSCYHEIMCKQDELDKNQKPYELKDYFYNLNSSIYRLSDNKYARGQIYKLFAIAWLVRDVYKDTQLSNVVVGYAKKIADARKNTPDLKMTSDRDHKDKATVAVTNLIKNRASDGHICKSEGEVIIDDFLYNNHIVHAYGIRVKEILAITERVVEADWYVPLGGSEGIYIEYWGMDKQDYQDNKEEKLKLYEKYKVKLIEIEKDDTKDRQNLEYRLYQELVSNGWKAH